MLSGPHQNHRTHHRRSNFNLQKGAKSLEDYTCRLYPSTPEHRKYSTMWNDKCFINSVECNERKIKIMVAGAEGTEHKAQSTWYIYIFLKIYVNLECIVYYWCHIHTPSMKASSFSNHLTIFPFKYHQSNFLISIERSFIYESLIFSKKDTNLLARARQYYMACMLNWTNVYISRQTYTTSEMVNNFSSTSLRLLLSPSNALLMVNYVFIMIDSYLFMDMIYDILPHNKLYPYPDICWPCVQQLVFIFFERQQL